MKRKIEDIEFLKGRDVVNHLAICLKINEIIKRLNIITNTLEEAEKK